MQNGRNVNSIKTEVRLLATVNLSISSRVLPRCEKLHFMIIINECNLYLESWVRSPQCFSNDNNDEQIRAKYRHYLQFVLYDIHFCTITLTLISLLLSAVSSERFANIEWQMLMILG